MHIWNQYILPETVEKGSKRGYCLDSLGPEFDLEVIPYEYSQGLTFIMDIDHIVADLTVIYWIELLVINIY